MKVSNSHQQKWVYGLTFVCVLIGAFSIQALALRSVGGRTTKSESNYFSSLGRIQSGVQIKPNVMLLGSSMTGRLPDESAGFPGVANLGCDGGSAVDTLRAIDEGRLPGAEVLVVEGNTLFLARGSGESEIAMAIRGPWFRLGLKVPEFSATARPAAFAYSKLLAKRIGKAGRPDGPFLLLGSHAEVPDVGSDLDQEAEKLVVELAARIARMKDMGMQVMIVILPPGSPPESPSIALPRKLAFLAQVPFWNLTEGLSKGEIRLTDGVHMDAASAAAVLRTLIAELPKNQILHSNE